MRIKKMTFLLIVISGCSSHKENEQSLFYSDGTPKPIVAILPVIDHSHHDLPWDLSEEFYLSFKDKLLQREKLFLNAEQKKQDYTLEGDLSWIKKLYPQKDFVVFFDLIEHVESALSTSRKDSPRELKTSMRLHIVDLRKNEPRISLEKVISDTQYIPAQFTKLQVPWGKEMYELTPLGLAHAKIASEVVLDIEEHILNTMQN